MADQRIQAVGDQSTTREGSISLHYPMLNKTNYSVWAIKMEVYMEAQGVWDAVESEEPVDQRKDKMALAAIYQGISEDTLLQLGAKKTAKEAWSVLKTMHLGAARVKEVRAQALRWELESMSMEDSDTIDGFTSKISMTVNRLRSLGEVIEESYVVKKILRAVSPKFLQIASTIEEFGDLANKTMEEVTGSLKAHEERMRGHEERRDNHVLIAQSENSRGGLSEGAEKYPRREYGYNRGRGDWRGRYPVRGRGRNPRYEGVRASADQQRRKFDISRIRCYSCDEYGHFSYECKGKKNREEEAHLAENKDDEPVLLMVEMCDLTITNETQQRMEEDKYDDKEEKGSEMLWHYDTGASSHMTGNRDAFTDFDESVGGSVKFGDGSAAEIKGRGAVLFECKNGDHLIVPNVYYLPRMKSNILSIGQLDENGSKVVVEGGVLRVFDAFGRLIAKVPRAQNRLYTQKMIQVNPVCLIAKIREQPWLWHARYGHVNFQTLRKMAREGLVEGLPALEQENQVCDCCAVSKQHRHSFPKSSSYRAEAPLQLVHADICGPITPATAGGNKYFLLLVDDFSRFMWIEFLKEKNGAFGAFKKFKAAAELESGQKLKMLRTDRGGEFLSGEFTKFCEDTGVKRQLTAPYSPQQNGVVERRNQTIMEMTRSLLKGKKVPNVYWGEATHTAVYILNRCASKGVQDMTPYQAWYGKSPKVDHLRIFGCVGHVKNVKPHLKKLEDRSEKMLFVGYEVGSKAYRFVDPKTNRLVVSRDVIFLEEESWNWDDNGEATELSRGGVLSVGFVEKRQEEVPAGAEISTTGTDQEPADGVAGSESTQHVAQSPTESTTVSTAHQDTSLADNPEMTNEEDDMNAEGPRGLRTLTDIYNNVVEENCSTGMCLLSIEEPNCFDEAAINEHWKQAMVEEMSSIERNGTWGLVDLPKGSKEIGLKWVYKLKKNPEGEILRYKARIVVKGYAQRYGIDYDEVFAPVARLETVRLLLALAAHKGWKVHHLDVKSAFLNGELEEDVFVSQPAGFEVRGQESKVLKLRKALYGLKQAPRAWNAKLDSSLHDLGFTRCQLENAVYTRKTDRGSLIVGVYVDDLIVMGSDTEDVNLFKEEMKQKFEMSDLGSLSYYLGIEVKQESGSITLSQAGYAAKVLEKMGMADCKTCGVPMDSRLKLSKRDDSPLVDATAYRSVIGSLRYLLNTRPDLSFSVGVLSRFMESPTTNHLSAVKQVLRYLKGTLTFGCRYYKKQEEKRSLVGFCDSDLAGDIDDRKSTTGVLYFFGSSPITWLSQKQKVVALSSCEAEYMAATAGCCQGIWLQRLLGELSGEEESELVLKMDNKSAMDLARNPVYHDRSKHIDKKFHFVRECVQSGDVKLSYVRTEEQAADILTKALPRGKFENMRELIGMINVKKEHD